MFKANGYPEMVSLPISEGTGSFKPMKNLIVYMASPKIYFIK